jgi:hypothetical protein
VHGADLERSEIARSEAVGVIGDTEDRLAAQDVEAFLVRVDVRRDRAARRQLGDAETRVHRPGGMIDERRLTVALAMPVVYRMPRKRGRVEVPEMMHGVDL